MVKIDRLTIGAGTSYLKNKPTTRWLIVLTKVKLGMTGGKVNLATLKVTPLTVILRIRKTAKGNY